MDKFKFSGVEIPLNNELKDLIIYCWLEYKFQAIWLFEIADKYNFLYHDKFKFLTNYFKNNY